jgi:hypothetical protein
MLEPAMFMSRMARSKNSRLCQNLCVLDIARLGNHTMPKLVDHLGKHHPDEGFIFDQEYGCLAHFDEPYIVGL